jgi:dTDP-4-amino-4,6-dideoxygalactose transaminase
MISAHPTLRFSDVYPQHAQSLHRQHAPQSLHLAYNARGAFYQLLLSMPKGSRDTVLLPAFHCAALIEPVVRAGYKTNFYRVRPDFTTDTDDLRAKLSQTTGLIVVIHFFGFPVDLGPVLEMAWANGSYVVEDCAHSFLSRENESSTGHRADFALFSYYKFAPSLAGGGLGVNRADFTLHGASAQAPLRERAVIAKRLVEQAALNSPHSPLSKLFLWFDRKRMDRKQTRTSGETVAVSSPSAFMDDPYLFREDLARATMPHLCKRILESCDWNSIAEARQRNYRLLSSLLHDGPAMRRVLPEMPDSVVPWAFPVLLENRLKHEQALRRLGVPLFTFGEVLHPALNSLHDPAREDAEFLSRRLLLLPVHANLGEADVTNYAKILSRYIGELGPDHPQQGGAEDSVASHTIIAGSGDLL